MEPNTVPPIRLCGPAFHGLDPRRTHGLGVEWDYPDWPDEVVNGEHPVERRLREGGLLAPKPERPARPSLPANEVGSGRRRAHAHQGLSNELRKLAMTTEYRNDTLNTCAFKCARFVRSGTLARDEVVPLFRQTALSIGLTEKEVDGTIRSAFAGADKQDSRHEVPDRDGYGDAYQIGEDGR